MKPRSDAGAPCILVSYGGLHAFVLAIIAFGLFINAARANGMARSIKLALPNHQRPISIQVKKARRWDRLLERSSGFIGSDCGYTIKIGHERTLWLFGDSFIGQVKGHQRVNAQMVHNSIAVLEGKQPDESRFHFYWGRQNGVNTPYIVPKESDLAYWFEDGAVVHRKLWLFLSQIAYLPTGGLFGFKMNGTALADADISSSDPHRWKFQTVPFPFYDNSGSDDEWFGAAVLSQGRYLYIYGLRQESAAPPMKRGLLVARVPADRIADFSRWRFWANGKWVANQHRAEASGSDLGAEMSVSFQPELGCYLLVYSPSDLAPVIRIRTAPEPYGPWSKAVTVYTCPEGKIPTVLCYAAKGHPELSNRNDLLISYATNSTDFEKVLHDSRLYDLRFIRLIFKK